MEKLMLLSPFVFILVSASAQSDVTVKSYNEETPFTFSTKYPSTTLLAYWTSDRNAKFIIEFEGLSFWKNGQHSLSLPFYPQGWRAWHFVSVTIKWISNRLTLQISPGTSSYFIHDRSDDITIKINSTGRIYWQRCHHLFRCDLPWPEYTATEFITDSTPHGTQDSTMDLTTLLLLGTSCLLVVIVVGLVAYIIRLKKSTFNEARSNTMQETFYEEIQMSRNSGNSPREGVAHETVNRFHETVNRLYGVIIPREERP